MNCEALRAWLLLFRPVPEITAGCYTPPSLLYREHSVIGFDSEETTLRKLREQLRLMSDEELIAFGRYARTLAGFRISGTGDPYKVKLDEARAEWRRRHHRNA